MSAINDSVMEKATTYLGEAPKQLSVDLAMEIYRDARHFPKSFTTDQIDADMTANLSKIAYAAIEIDAKIGVEGQISHNDNGTNRGYGNLPLPKAYASVVQFADVKFNNTMQ